MSSDTPDQGGVPGWGQPQQPAAPEQQTGWGQATPPPAQPGWGAPPPQAPQQQPGWGAPPPQQQPAQPGWGTPPQAPQQPGWGAPPPQQPAQPAWGAPPPQAPQQQPGWGAPPPQQQGWAPQPQGAWAPPPKKSNGCLKGCLIIGGILLALVIVLVIAMTVFGLSFLNGLGIQADGTLKACPFVSNTSLETVLGKDTVASELGGLADATFGQVLDKRVLKDAPDCWVGAGSQSTAGLGRIAKYSGSDAASKFAAEHTTAAASYLAVDLSGVGDEAFCTGVSDFTATGALVRKGNDLVYVSLIDAGPAAGTDTTTNAQGVIYSKSSCQLAQQVALLVLK